MKNSIKNQRRKFLQMAGTLTAGSLILPQFGCNEPKTDAGKNNTSITPPKVMAKPSIDEFGIQLYTLRDDFPKDPKGILKQLSSFGYKQIEGYEGPDGMFWGMGNKAYKKYLDSIGLDMVSSHVDVKKDFEKKAAEAAEIGMKYRVCPYVGPQKSMDDWKKITDLFNRSGEICRKNGIKFAYHNHAYSFKAFSGMIPHDYIMDNTDPDLVDHEMDIYWVVTGGADPIKYLEKYPNRFRLCHVKDRLKTASAEENEASCNLGTGIIDFPKILNVAKQNGMQYFIVEQERYDDSTPIESAKVGAEYLNKLVFA